MYTVAYDPYPSNGADSFPKLEYMNQFAHCDSNKQRVVERVIFHGKDPWKPENRINSYTVPSNEEGGYTTVTNGIYDLGFTTPKGQYHQSLVEAALDTYRGQVISTLTNLDSFEDVGAFEDEDMRGRPRRDFKLQTQRTKPMPNYIYTAPSGRKYLKKSILDKY